MINNTDLYPIVKLFTNTMLWYRYIGFYFSLQVRVIWYSNLVITCYIKCGDGASVAFIIRQKVDDKFK